MSNRRRRRPWRRTVTLAPLIALALVPLVAHAADPPLRATMFKSTQQSVRVTFQNDGAETIVALRQIVPDPYVVTEAVMDGATCVVRARGEYGCSGFTAAPGSTWDVLLDIPSVYNDQTGLDSSYYPADGPATFFVSTSASAELGPFSADWVNAEVPTTPSFELGVVRMSVVPARPRAGRPFEVRVALATTDLAALRKSGRVTCRAVAGARRLALVRRGISASGQARCGWTLPRSAAGRRVRGTIAVQRGRVDVRRSFAIAIAGAR
jgi:hypothetical protein